MGGRGLVEVEVKVGVEVEGGGVAVENNLARDEGEGEGGDSLWVRGGERKAMDKKGREKERTAEGGLAGVNGTAIVIDSHTEQASQRTEANENGKEEAGKR